MSSLSIACHHRLSVGLACRRHWPALRPRRRRMIPVRLSLSALKKTHWHEYAVRFALGGTATVFTGIIGAKFGATIGGLFLALPAIFCASATLIERHERHVKEKVGYKGN